MLRRIGGVFTQPHTEADIRGSGAGGDCRVDDGVRFSGNSGQNPGLAKGRFRQHRPISDVVFVARRRRLLSEELTLSVIQLRSCSYSYGCRLDHDALNPARRERRHAIDQAKLDELLHAYNVIGSERAKIPTSQVENGAKASFQEMENSNEDLEQAAGS